MLQSRARLSLKRKSWHFPVATPVPKLRQKQEYFVARMAILATFVCAGPKSFEASPLRPKTWGISIILRILRKRYC